MSQITYRATWMSILASMKPQTSVEDLVVPGISIRRPVSITDLEKGLRAFRCHGHRDQSIAAVKVFLRDHPQEIVYILADSDSIEMKANTLEECKSLGDDPSRRIIEMVDDDRMMITHLRPKNFKQMTRDVMGIYANKCLSRNQKPHFVILMMPVRNKLLLKRWSAVHRFISSYTEVLPALGCLCFDIEPEQSVLDAVIAMNFTRD